MLVNQNLQDDRRAKTWESLFGKTENQLDKISQRNQNKRNERKIKQFHYKRFGTSKEEDKKMEINKNKQNPFRTKDIVMENNTDNQEKQNESIWWNVCKNIINLKEWREQFK